MMSRSVAGPMPTSTARFKDGIEVGFFQPKVLNPEVRTVVPPGAHRVGLGEEVSSGSVIVDQVDHPEFLRPYARTFSGRRSRGRTRFEGILAVDALGEVKAQKKMTPSRVDRVGIVEELPIKSLNGGRLGVAQMGVEVHVFAGATHKVKRTGPAKHSRKRRVFPQKGWSINSGVR